MTYDQVLVERISEILDGRPGFTSKKMFGCYMWWLNGYSCCGVSEDRLLIKVSPTEYPNLLKGPGTHDFGREGRPMKGWVLVEAEYIDTEEDLRKWMQPALDYAKSLPVKVK